MDFEDDMDKACEVVFEDNFDNDNINLKDQDNADEDEFNVNGEPDDEVGSKLSVELEERGVSVKYTLCIALLLCNPRCTSGSHTQNERFFLFCPLIVCDLSKFNIL